MSTRLRLIARHILVRLFNVSFVIFLSSVAVINHAWSALHHSGATLGTFGVTGSGAAKYSIALEVPPGTRGMSPTLQLTYRPSKGNGLLGVGWSLSGVSRVHRCSQTIAQDGNVKGVDYTVTDRFCIDGQRLVAVNGDYGNDQTEYKTEIASYAKIVSYGGAGTGPASFKVWTKSGQIIEYGASDDSRILAQGKDEARVWAINKTSDTSSNYIQYSYFQDTAIGHYRLDRIDYTGNDTAGTTPSASVRMVYETRTDISEGYLAGSKYSSPVRLSKIQTYVGPTKVKEYQLTYEYGAATKRSRLVKLLECNGNECKLSNSFTWTQPLILAYEKKETPVPAIVPSATYYRTGDFNGDGVSDLIYMDSDTEWKIRIGAGDGTFIINSAYTSTFTRDMGDVRTYQIGDINGDGRSDLFYLSSANKWVIYFANMDGTLGVRVETQEANDIADMRSVKLIDMNNDSKADIVYFVSGSLWAVRIGKGDGTFGPRVHTVHDQDLAEWRSYQFNDFNGDGIKDLFYFAIGSIWTVRLGNGDGTFASRQNTLHDQDLGDWGSLRLADINGDGNSDIIYYSAGAAGPRWAYRLGKGDGTFFSTKYFSYFGNMTTWNSLSVSDANGDRFADIFYLSRDANYKIRFGDGQVAKAYNL